MNRKLFLPAIGVAAAITLAGCAGNENPAASGSATASSQQSAPSNAGSQVSAEHNDADTMFAQMMIPHHKQAVQMSELMLAKDGIDNKITDLATTIKEAQGPEIQTMTGWLKTWGEPTASDMGGHGMEGMMTDEQLKELESAQGTDASRMFLESMTEHHKGAVGMAEDEIADGKNPQAIALAKQIEKTQQAEIKKMQDLLAGL
ncbi:DUF305 domain-containing protein [Arthrobacter rhombi]|uniref:DUF305 domain-containing protein n=1 Tax=Arthrobacter rhombi TaxID=71253 RepID=UPI0031D163AE